MNFPWFRDGVTREIFGRRCSSGSAVFGFLRKGRGEEDSDSDEIQQEERRSQRQRERPEQSRPVPLPDLRVRREREVVLRVGHPAGVLPRARRARDARVVRRPPRGRAAPPARRATGIPARFARSEKSRSPHAIGNRAASGRPMRSKTAQGTNVPIPKSQSAGKGSAGSDGDRGAVVQDADPAPPPFHRAARRPDARRAPARTSRRCRRGRPGFASTASPSLSK